VSPRRAAAAAAWLLGAAAAQASSARYCEPVQPLSAGQQATLLRFAARIKAELDRSGQAVALVARSGLDLSRLGLRYSHAGLSLLDNPASPWAVRQLYYACDEQQPRLFDQGLTGFLLGSDNPQLGYVSVLLLPAQAAQPLAAAALDKARALQLLHPAYSANAYAFSTTFQNCNQWVAELLAAAWGPPLPASAPRAAAQQWLQSAGYQPSAIEVGWPLRWAGAFIPWLHDADHPAPALAQGRYGVSMPASLEAFVQARVPGTQRVEFCHHGAQMVVHRGWSPVADGCVAGPGDELLALD
jgi:hypothetical protein